MNLTRQVRVGLSVSLGTLGVLASSAIAAGWSSPTAIPGSQGRLPKLATLSANGAADVFAIGPLPIFPGSPEVPVAVAARAASGTFASPARLPSGFAEPVAVSSGGEVIAVAGPTGPDDYFGGDSGAGVRLRVAIGRLNGPLRRVGIGRVTATRTLAAAINDRGDAAVLFSRCRGRNCATTSVWAIFRRHGGAFGAPLALARKTYRAAGSVTLNASGDALLAWEQNAPGTRYRSVLTRLRTAKGRLTPVRAVGPTAPSPTIALTLTSARAGVVAWFSETSNEGGIGGPATVTAASVSPAGSVGAQRVLDTFAPPGGGEHAASTVVEGARLRAVLDPDNRTTLVWTGHDQAYVVRAVRFPSSSDAQSLSPPGQAAELADLATDAAGDVVAAWAGGEHPTSLAGPPFPGIGVAVRSGPAPPFEAPETALANNSQRAYGTAAVAITPGAQHILVAGGPHFAIGGRNQPPIDVTERTG